jgi:hypothetical protein
MHISEAVELLDAFVRYAYNVEFDDFKQLFPQAMEGYQLEKYKYMQRNLGAFFGELDPVHREVLVELLVKRYAEKEHKEIDLDHGAWDGG